LSDDTKQGPAAANRGRHPWEDPVIIFLAVVAGALLLYDGTNNDGW
jgi:hypothetical protein